MKEGFEMNIGNNIFELRKSRKLTQGQLAEKLGVTEQSVSKWENNICMPDVSLFPVIAKLFSVSIDRIYGFHLDSYDKEVEEIIRAADAPIMDRIAGSWSSSAEITVAMTWVSHR